MQQVSSEVGKREYQCFTFGSGCTEGFAAYKVLSGLYSELTCWWSWVCLPSRSPNHHHGSVHSCIWPPQGCLQEEYCKFYIKHWLNTLGTVLLTTKCECWNGIKVYVMCRLFIVGFLAASPEQREFMIAHDCSLLRDWRWGVQNLSWSNHNLFPRRIQPQGLTKNSSSQW